MKWIRVTAILAASVWTYAASMRHIEATIPEVGVDPVWVEFRSDGKIRISGIGPGFVVVRLDRGSRMPKPVAGITIATNGIAIGGRGYGVYAGEGFSIYCPAPKLHPEPDSSSPSPASSPGQ